MSQRRILITGGSGFIGTNLVSYYLNADVPVANFDALAPRNPDHANAWHEGSVLDHDAFTRVVDRFQPTHVLHMAARTDLDGKDLAAYSANVEGVDNVLRGVATVGCVKRVIYASSRMVCRIAYQPEHDEDYCPNTVYGESKAAGEKIVRGATGGVPWVIVRPASIWGPWFDVPYRDFFNAIARGRYVHPGSRRILKSFGYVGNTVHQLEQILAADDDDVVSETFYLADWPPLDLETWAKDIQSELHTKPIRHAPMPVLRLAAIAGDLLERVGDRKAPLTTFRLDNLTTTMTYDTKVLERVVGALPFSATDGVAATVAWMREHELV